MMLKHSFGLDTAHDQILLAIEKTLEQGVLTADLTDETAVSTEAMGSHIIEQIRCISA